MAQIYKWNGNLRKMNPKNGEYFTCDEITEYFNDTYQYLDAGDGGSLFIDDSGKLKGLPTNIKASLFYKKLGGNPFDEIAGDMIHLSKKEMIEMEKHID